MKNLAHIGEALFTFGKLSGLMNLMGNSEGSLVIPQIYKARRNLILRTSAEQLSIILGSVLGDAYIYPQGKICFEQSADQKEYLLWKYNILKDLSYPKVARVIRFDRRYSKKNTSFRFFLRQYFRPLRHIFYVDGRKIVPDCLSEKFNSLVLAVWYMDDGHLEHGKYPLFASEGFSDNDIGSLAKMIFSNFGVETKVDSKRRIRISNSSKDKFFKLVEPWVRPNLRYKLP